MKKTSIFVATTLALVMGLVGCAGADDSTTTKEHVAQTVDLRNYKGDKVSFLETGDAGRAARSAFTAAREANTEFSYEFVGIVPRFIGENGVEVNHPSYWKVETPEPVIYDIGSPEFGAIVNSVKIKDDPKGIRFIFNRPEGYEKSKFTYVNVQFLDMVGHKSTGIGFGGEKLTDTDEDPKVEIVYPLVDPESELETRFWIQIATDDYYADLTYKVVPIHGEGSVKPVQEDYRIRDYLELSEDGVMTLKLTVPPVAKDGTLIHSIGLHMQKGDAPAYTEEAGQPEGLPLCIVETASEEEIIASKLGTICEYKVDFKKLFDELEDAEKAEVLEALKETPYIWASFIYDYEVPVEGFEEFTFSTPWVISNTIKNPFAGE